jgi:hypothetical protein
MSSVEQSERDTGYLERDPQSYRCNYQGMTTWPDDGPRVGAAAMRTPNEIALPSPDPPRESPAAT